MITSDKLVAKPEAFEHSEPLPEVSLDAKFKELLAYLRELFVPGHANHALVEKAAKTRSRAVLEQVRDLFHSESHAYQVAEAALRQLPEPK